MSTFVFTLIHLQKKFYIQLHQKFTPLQLRAREFATYETMRAIRKVKRVYKRRDFSFLTALF